MAELEPLLGLVGNDLVDLSLPSVRSRCLEPCYYLRALAPSEAARFERQGPSPELFWGIWAAKEAAFKVLSKLDPRLKFAPRSFLVEWDSPLKKGWVEYGSKRVEVEWSFGDSWVHCVAVLFTAEARVKCLSTQVQRAGNDPDESLQARKLCRELLRENGIPSAKLVRSTDAPEGTGPLRLWLGGNASKDTDISLSHDGQWIAAAILSASFT